MVIAVYARPTKDNPSAYVEQIYDCFKKEKVDLIIHKPYYNYICKEQGFKLPLQTFSTSEELISKASYLISLGGDGTILEAITLVKRSGIPLLGVNTGRLGFLASVNKNDLHWALKELLDKKFTLDKRELIELSG